MDKDNKYPKLAENFRMAAKNNLQLPQLFTMRMKSLLKSKFEEFEASLLEESPVAVRINPAKWIGTLSSEKVPWCSTGFYVGQRPLFTADPWFHGGTYYVQEPSSMFLEQIFRAVQLPDQAVVLDLCAAPGGKTTHLLSLLKPDDLLVTNEVIRDRAAILRENVRKWGAPNVIITQNDPQDFGRLANVFDLIVVDAPCSGEGLFRKDPSAIAGWSPGNIILCAARQKRILAEAWKCLKPGGFLVYSTCTYNEAENEDNIIWLTEQAGAIPVEINTKPEWNIRTVFKGNATGYRFFPHLTRGEGFFLGVVRKQGNSNDATPAGKYSLKKWLPAPKQISDMLRNWIMPGFSGNFLMKEDEYYIFPPDRHLALFEKYLNILQLGTPVATGKNAQLNPHPALALSLIYHRSAFPEISLSLADAIRYLRKENLSIKGEVKGWVLVSFRNIPLGWLKNLGNRTNNYFPKDQRIRMEISEVPRLWHEH